MNATLSEKILAKASGKDRVKPDEFIVVKPDAIMGNEISGAWAIDILKELGGRLYDPSKVILIPDHGIPNKDQATAELTKKLRLFAKKLNVQKYFEVGKAGISHNLMIEQGLVKPGNLLVGGDSHTCTAGAIGAFGTGVGNTDLAVIMATGEMWMRVPYTLKCTYSGFIPKWITGKDFALLMTKTLGPDEALYKTIEFHGLAIEHLDIAGRISLCNMAVECGAKTGIVPADKTTIEFTSQFFNKMEATKLNYENLKPDPNAYYEKEYKFDVSDLTPLVAIPNSPSNVYSIEEISGIEINQAFIGSCTNGMVEDLRLAAQVLDGKKVHPDVRLIIIPATPKVWKQSMEEGLLNIFTETGAVVGYPTCGPCSGQHMGVLAKGERSVSTTSRNFIGRMGHPSSEVYLANPAVAAASAIAGKLIHPEEVI